MKIHSVFRFYVSCATLPHWDSRSKNKSKCEARACCAVSNLVLCLWPRNLFIFCHWPWSSGRLIYLLANRLKPQIFIVVAQSLQLCLTLCHPMACSPPGSSVPVIFQAGIRQWVALPSSRGSSWPKDRTESPAFPALQVESLPAEPSYPWVNLCVFVLMCMCTQVASKLQFFICQLLSWIFIYCGNVWSFSIPWIQ